MGIPMGNETLFLLNFVEDQDTYYLALVFKILYDEYGVLGY